MRCAFTLLPGRWVDLDTLVESTLHGLRDAGGAQPRFAGLDAIVATKHEDPTPGTVVTAAAATVLTAQPPPGPQLLAATTARIPRPADRDSKRAWRDTLGSVWGSRPPLDADLWIDLSLGVATSLLGPLEVALDALEPVLGRDPRGRSWQEFFPNDHRIVWLRVRRDVGAAGMTMRLGLLADP